MKKLLFILIVFIPVTGLFAQTPVEPVPEPEPQADTAEPVYEFSEKIPEYPGGEEARNKFISKNLKYPKEAIKNEAKGTVYVEFIVETDGSLSNIKILRDIGYGCGEEVVRVISKMPNWTPGSQKDKPVRVKMRLPIRFEIK